MEALYYVFFHSWQTVAVWGLAFVLGSLMYFTGADLDFKCPKHQKLQTLMRLMLVADITLWFITDWRADLDYFFNLPFSLIIAVVAGFIGVCLSALVSWVFGKNE
jgi:hypothetical protein